MCLAVPAKLVELRGDLAVADMTGTRLEISVVLTPEAQAGDWVLIHAGFAIQRLSPEEAGQIWTALREAGVVDRGMGTEAPA